MYQKYSNKLCSSAGSSNAYGSFDHAKMSCNSDPSCVGLYQSTCDESSFSFMKCSETGFALTHSSNACVHKKLLRKLIFSNFLAVCVTFVKNLIFTNTESNIFFS